MFQKTVFALLIGGLLALAGCATPSEIVLNDGSRIQTVDVPDFDESSGFYQFEELNGKPARVNKDQVVTIKEL